MLMHQVPADSSSLQILVVDDSHDTVDTLAMLLRTLGHETTPLYHAATVLEAAPSLRPDLMLIDLAMPQIDGCQLARQLRQDERLSESTLIAMSGYADPVHQQLAKNAGFDGFLVKPFSLAQLQDLIASVGTLRQRAREARMRAEQLQAELEIKLQRSTEIITKIIKRHETLAKAANKNARWREGDNRSPTG